MDAQAEAAGDAPDRNQPASEGAVRDLIDVVQHLAATNTWRRVGRIFAALSIGGLIGGGLGLGLIVKQAHDQSLCVQQWANATAARTNVLAPLTANQLRAINDAFSALTKATPAEQRDAFTKAQRDELAAYRAYHDAFGDTPPPPSPALTC